MKHTGLLQLLKKGIFLSASALTLSAPVFAQTIATNAIFGPDPGLTSPFTSGQSTNVGVTANGISRGPGISGALGDDRYNAVDFTTSTTLDAADYFEFTITPNAGNFINFSELSFTLQINAVGPTSFALRSSLDGYTSNIAATSMVSNPIFASVAGQVNTVSLAGAQYDNVTTPITFRLYGFAANGNGAQLSVNDYAFSGTVSSTPLSNNLLAFDARSESSGVRLMWKTTCTSDASSYTIEKSVSGKEFTAIGTVQAVSSCLDEGRAYTFSVPAESGRTIYRLAMRDGSGYLEYSRSVAIAGNAAVANNNGIAVFPSVASSSLIIRGVEVGKACRILDLSGRTLRSWTSTGGEESVSVGNLPAGAYILFAETAGGPSAQRFWKQ